MITNKVFPKWILIVSAVIALLELVVAIVLATNPQSVVESIDWDSKATRFLVYMWATRQFALGVIFGYATFKKSAQMLTLSYVFFTVMMAGDMLIGITLNETTTILTAVVMMAFSIFMIYTIAKRTRH